MRPEDSRLSKTLSRSYLEGPRAHTPLPSVWPLSSTCEWRYYHLPCQNKRHELISKESFELLGRRRDTKYFCDLRDIKPGLQFHTPVRPGRLQGKAGPGRGNREWRGLRRTRVPTWAKG